MQCSEAGVYQGLRGIVDKMWKSFLAEECFWSTASGKDAVLCCVLGGFVRFLFNLRDRDKTAGRSIRTTFIKVKKYERYRFKTSGGWW